jgi:hypothetical protein
MLICPLRLALISCLSANCSALRTFVLQLLGTPGSLLGLLQALLATLCFRPGSEHAAIPTSRHRSSQREQYDLDETKIQEFAIW